jgi:hypothetical protein
VGLATQHPASSTASKTLICRNRLGRLGVTAPHSVWPTLAVCGSPWPCSPQRRKSWLDAGSFRRPSDAPACSQSNFGTAAALSYHHCVFLPCCSAQAPPTLRSRVDASDADKINSDVNQPVYNPLCAVKMKPNCCQRPGKSRPKTVPAHLDQRQHRGFLFASIDILRER